jgi:hypothetical protein
MNKEFIPYELALRMKALGFDGFTLFHINRNNVLNSISESPTSMFQYNMEPNEDDTDSLVAAPTFSQAFRWFREKYNLFGYSYPNDYQTYGYRIVEVKSPENKELIYDWGTNNTNEEAELACITALINIVEEKQN